MGYFESIDKNTLEEIISKSRNWVEVLEFLGIYNIKSTHYTLIRKRCLILGIDISRLELQSNQNHRSSNKPLGYTDEEIFTENTVADISTVRKHFRNLTSIPYKCSICGQEPFWNGKPLTLTMDHIDGNNRNNYLSNLRWVCPNCDRQLETFGSKNKITHSVDFDSIKQRKKNICPLCGNEKEKEAKYCKECWKRQSQLYIKDTLIERPTRQELKNLIYSKSFLEIGKMYHVSDNTIRKWCKQLCLPYKKSQIIKYSRAEWEKV